MDKKKTSSSFQKEERAKCLIRVFPSGRAEILEGKSLQNFNRQESAGLGMLFSHGWTMPIGKIIWKPLRKVRIER